MAISLEKNPLQTGEIFDFEGLNPNPSARKTQEGPVYRVSFEVPQEIWRLFMESNTKGMMIAAKMMVAQDGQFIEPERPPNELARKLHANGFFRNQKIWPLLGTDADYQAWCRKQKCAKCGAVAGIEYAHVRRIVHGAGAGVKPEYSGIPLCGDCHHLQHLRGESAFGEFGVGSGKAWFDAQRIKHLEKWAHDAYKAYHGLESLAGLTEEQHKQFVGLYEGIY